MDPILPSEVTWKFHSWKPVRDRLGCFLVALLTGGSFSYVQRRIIKSFSSLSFPSDSLCDILCATSNFSSWNWDPGIGGV